MVARVTLIGMVALIGKTALARPERAGRSLRGYERAAAQSLYMS